MKEFKKSTKTKKAFVPRPKTIATLVKFKDGAWGIKFTMLPKSETLPPKDGKGKCIVLARFELESGEDENGASILLNGMGRSISLLEYHAPKKAKNAPQEVEEDVEVDAEEDADVEE